MYEAARAAKLPKGTVFCRLRHAFIASAIIGSVDIHTVAEIMGTSVRMIEQHYGRLLQDDARERLNRIVRVIAGLDIRTIMPDPAAVRRKRAR